MNFNKDNNLVQQFSLEIKFEVCDYCNAATLVQSSPSKTQNTDSVHLELVDGKLTPTIVTVFVVVVVVCKQNVVQVKVNVVPQFGKNKIVLFNILFTGFNVKK